MAKPAPFPPTKKFKRPESVLVVVYTLTGKVLLLRRAPTSHVDEVDFWQSVTGSLLWEETAPRQAALRELQEETGLDAASALQDLGITHHYPILPRWRARYAADVLENVEYAFALALPQETSVTLNPAEHAEYAWFFFDEAAAQVTSWTNRDVILNIRDKHKKQ